MYYLCNKFKKRHKITNKILNKIMVTFIFTIKKIGTKTLKVCRYYEGELTKKEIKKQILEDEKLVNYETADICTF